MATFREAASGMQAGTLIAHSNAGHYAPSVAREAGAGRIVFMDAALPRDSGPGRLAPEGLLEQVAGLADDDGWLPGWTRWWDRAIVAGLFPDPVWVDRIEADQPRAALDYFKCQIQAPEAWHAEPCSYLAFGDRYQEELERAARHGWPTAATEGNHLQYLSDPAGVADSIEGLLAGLADRDGYRQTR